MRILYIDIDTTRADHLSCYGYHRKTTPHIDKIAKEGTIFTECYVSDAPCLPSRAALFMGQFGIHTGVIGHGGTAADMRVKGKDRGFVNPQYQYFWTYLIRKAKYYPVTISPFAERHSAYWFCAGWREMFNPGLMGLETANIVFPYVENWLNKNGKMDNWFLHVNTWDPHAPYRTPPDYENPFLNDPIPSWITQDIIDEHRKSYGPHSARDIWGIGTPMEAKFYTKAFPLAGILEMETLEDYRKWIDGYDMGIHYADNMVGKIVEILKNLEVYDNTLIMISSDHGESQGELNVYGDHATADHIINRVPMIIKWPNMNWDKKYSSLIYQSDIATTILEGIGGKIPKTWDGKSFFNQIQNGEEFGRKYLILSQNAWSCQRAVRFDRWTFIRTYHTGLKDLPKYMLFDYENDFHMTSNLAETHVDIRNKALQLLEDWQWEMMKTSETRIDPIWTVIKEGGPHHARYELKGYLKRLKKSGREHLIQKILDRNEAYITEGKQPPEFF
ncbi:MAG: sulfatase [Promethearchaeota archaeon]